MVKIWIYEFKKVAPYIIEEIHIILLEGYRLKLSEMVVSVKILKEGVDNILRMGEALRKMGVTFGKI